MELVTFPGEALFWAFVLAFEHFEKVLGLFRVKCGHCSCDYSDLVILLCEEAGRLCYAGCLVEQIDVGAWLI